MQIGLAPGPLQGLGGEGQGRCRPRRRSRVSISPGAPLTLVIGARRRSRRVARSRRRRTAELKKTFEEGVAASRAGNHDDAIATFQHAAEVERRTCFDCYYNIALLETQKKDYDKAEAAYKKAIELKADYAEAYSGLANIYNMQRKFDQAAAASAKAMELSGGGAARRRAATPDAMFNQGVILWNAGKIADAKKQFEATIAAKPDHAEAHYQLGMALVNEGATSRGAGAEFETYVQLAPNGPNAATAKGILAHDQEVIDSVSAPHPAGRTSARASRGPPAGPGATLPRSASSPSRKRFPAELRSRRRRCWVRSISARTRSRKRCRRWTRRRICRFAWHLVGHLQSNKAKKAGRFDVIHSVDSAALVSRLDEAARRAANRPSSSSSRWTWRAKPPSTARRKTKWPAVFEAARSLTRGAGRSASCCCRPFFDDPEAARPFFRRLSDAAPSAFWPAALIEPALQHLSMGMSHDFEVAVEEGATLVRVGTAIFGGRSVR